MYNTSITQSKIFMDNFRMLRGFMNLTLRNASELSGISLGCVRHIRYGMVVPRYDRLIRLLAVSCLPDNVIGVEEKARLEILDELTKAFLQPIRDYAHHSLDNPSPSPCRSLVVPSTKRTCRVAENQIPNLDFVVRLVVDGALSPSDLIPSFSKDSILSTELSSLDTAELFATILRLFSFEV